MNNKIHIDSEVVKLLYFKYRAYIIPFFVFIIAWAIFFQFVIPQIQNFLTVKDEVNANEQILAVLTQNYNTLTSLSDRDVTMETDIATHALPQVKDFAGILNAISTAAGISNVAVNDYSFQIGDINNSTTQPGQNNQSIQLALTIKGDIDETKQFLTALSQQLPLSEVTTLSLLSKGETSLTADFFYNPAPAVTFVDTNPLPLISTSQKNLLQNLENNANVTTSIPVVLPSPVISQSPSSSASSHSL